MKFKLDADESTGLLHAFFQAPEFCAEIRLILGSRHLFENTDSVGWRRHE